jgi:hypothetical protein
MKVAEYVPDTRFVLSDMEKEKEQILYHRCEKLAIAFGLLNTGPKITIQVVQRVCGDYYSVIQLIFTIVAWELIVRDANLHCHLWDGHCSSGDYW